jgi:hypothetical protein
MREQLTPGTDEYNLWRRYQYLERREKTGWRNFEHFVKWSKENGHFRGAFLRKKDKDKPVGPSNAFWSVSPAYYYSDMQANVSNESAFCVGCTKRQNPELCQGCNEYREWYIKNWDERIHVDLNGWIAKAQISDRDKDSKFRYEHPDIEREMKAKGEM